MFTFFESETTKYVVDISQMVVAAATASGALAALFIGWRAAVREDRRVKREEQKLAEDRKKRKEIIAQIIYVRATLLLGRIGTAEKKLKKYLEGQDPDDPHFLPNIFHPAANSDLIFSSMGASEFDPVHLVDLPVGTLDWMFILESCIEEWDNGVQQLSHFRDSYVLPGHLIKEKIVELEDLSNHAKHVCRLVEPAMKPPENIELRRKKVVKKNRPSPKEGAAPD